MESNQTPYVPKHPRKNKKRGPDGNNPGHKMPKRNLPVKPPKAGNK